MQRSSANCSYKEVSPDTQVANNNNNNTRTTIATKSSHQNTNTLRDDNHLNYTHLDNEDVRNNNNVCNYALVVYDPTVKGVLFNIN